MPVTREESNLFTGDIDKLRDELSTIRHEHFNARNPSAKLKWREADEAKRREIARLLEDSHFLSHDNAYQLAAWDPYDQNTSAPFFDSDWMFGLPVGNISVESKAPSTILGKLALINDAGGQTELIASHTKEIDRGFDIVIGNPPYVRQEQITQLKPKLERVYRSFDGRADLFVYFYEAAVRLLKQGGVLAFISSNKWLRAKYGRALREFLSKECLPRVLIDFGELPVFSAATFPMVFLGVRGLSASCTFVQVPSLDDPYPNVSQVVMRHGISLKTEQLQSDIWNFAASAESSILDLISTAPIRIPSHTIMAGIKTGFNEAFWLDEDRQSALLRKDKTIKAFIKPLLVGDDVRKFRTKPISRWIIYTPIGTDPAKLGVLKEHLAQWKPRLEQRALDQAWYELQQAQQRYCEQFEHPKIVFPDIAMESRFTFDTSGRYVDMTAFAISSSDKSLVGILNSRVVWFFLKKTAAVLGDADKRGRLRLKRQYVERIPLPEVGPSQKTVLVILVDVLLYLSGQFEEHPEVKTTRDPLMLAFWERVLNGLVYELYFPKELQQAGLKLFDLVQHVDMPDFDSIPESERLKRLRRIFEALYDGTHPLRIALDKLQTLDIVRIVEGEQ